MEEKKTVSLKEVIKVAMQHSREFDKRYISRVPRKPLPVGYVLAHNHIAHTKDMPVGLNGFRIWTQKAETEGLELCKCGWQGVVHYHFKGGSHKSFTRAALEKRFGEKLYDWVGNKDGSVSEVRLKR
jgi:hypothetical protein